MTATSDASLPQQARHDPPVAPWAALRCVPFAAPHAVAIGDLLRRIGWEERFVTGQLHSIAGLAADAEGARVLVALAGHPAGAEQLVGFITVQVYAWNGLAQIHGLAVAPELRRRGAGRTLVERVEGFARERGARGLYVDTPAGNTRGRAFYEAVGFTFAYRMPEYYGPGDDGVTYLKHLHPVAGPGEVAAPTGAALRVGAGAAADQSSETWDELEPLLGDKTPLVRDLVARLSGIPGVAGVALGGSYASGTSHPDSDVDLGLYYHQAAPFSIEAVRRVADSVNDTPDPVVTDFGGWGKWVNGGAWLTVRGQRVDFIYRSVERLRHWIEESARGEFEQDYYVHDAYGFRSYVYLGELRICRPLYDPQGTLAALKGQVETYPPALKRELIRTWLPVSGNSFYSLRKAAARGDVYMAVGCLTRVVAMLTQVLFALNDTYFITDKGALERIERFPLRPEGYAAAVRDLLGRPGTTRVELEAAASRLEELHGQVAALCGEWLSDGG